MKTAISFILTLFAALCVVLLMASASEVFGQVGAMMPSVYPVFQNSAGSGPVANGFVCTTSSGTSTLQATFREYTNTTANQNPIRLNASGRAVNGATLVPIFLGPVQYRITLYAAGTGNTCNGVTMGAQVWQQDNVYDFGQLMAASLVTITSLNNRQFCAAAGANFGVKFTNAAALLPSTGGIIDCSNLQGAQTIASDVFTGQTKPILLIWPTGTASSSVSLTIPATTTVDFPQGGILSMASATTATVNGGVTGTLSQHFAGTGRVQIEDVYAQWFGALGDGSNDDTAEITAAMAAIPTSSGGILRMPCGDYVVSSVTTVTTQVSMVGGGYCTRISYTTAGADIQNILAIDTGRRITISGMVLDGNRNVNASPSLNGINVVGGDAIMIRNIWCEQIPGAASTSYGDCIEVGDSASTETSDLIIENVFTNNVFRNGLSIEKVSRVTINNFNCFTMIGTNPGACIDYEPDGSQLAQEVAFSNITCNTAVHCILMTGDTPSTPRPNGLTISNVSSSTTTDSAIFIHGTNISIIGGTIKASNTSVTTRGAVYIQGSTTANSQNIVVSGLNITDCRGYGVQVFGATGVTIVGNTINECGGHGIAVLPAAAGVGGNDAITITGNTITNGGNGGASSAGIYLDDNSTHLISELSITGNVITDTQATPTQDYGIENAGSSSDQSTWRISGNVTTGNQTSAFNGTFNNGNTWGVLAGGPIALTAGGTNGTVAIVGTGTGGLTVGGGGPINQILVNSAATINFGNTAAQTSDDQTATVTGATTGDACFTIGYSVGDANSAVTCAVSGANTVTVRFHNYSAGAINPASATYQIVVVRLVP